MNSKQKLCQPDNYFMEGLIKTQLVNNYAAKKIEFAMKKEKSDIINQVLPDGIHYQAAYEEQCVETMITAIKDFLDEHKQEFIKCADDAVSKQILLEYGYDKAGCFQKVNDYTVK